MFVHSWKILFMMHHLKYVNLSSLKINLSITTSIVFNSLWHTPLNKYLMIAPQGKWFKIVPASNTNQFNESPLTFLTNTLVADKLQWKLKLETFSFKLLLMTFSSFSFTFFMLHNFFLIFFCYFFKSLFAWTL